MRFGISIDDDDVDDRKKRKKEKKKNPPLVRILSWAEFLWAEPNPTPLVLCPAHGERRRDSKPEKVRESRLLAGCAALRAAPPLPFHRESRLGLGLSFPLRFFLPQPPPLHRFHSIRFEFAIAHQRSLLPYPRQRQTLTLILILCATNGGVGEGGRRRRHRR